MNILSFARSDHQFEKKSGFEFEGSVVGLCALVSSFILETTLALARKNGLVYKYKCH